MKFSLRNALVCTTASMAFGASFTAVAQDETPVTVNDAAEDVSVQDTVVVRGIRGSIQKSLDTKRNASNLVDAISAEDVGKFPDGNIADSLQRITGVAIDRAGGEGQFITVRGLGPEFNNVLINGRTMATNNVGREFSFDSLASGIISSAEVYKTPLPSLQEGGIGATVNIVTSRPLSAESGFNGSVSAAAVFDTLREETSPDLNGAFTLNNGNWGLAGGIGYSNRKSQQDVVDIAGWVLNDLQVINGTLSDTGLTTDDFITLQNVHSPRNIRFSRELDERERITANLTFQSQLSDRAELTLDGLYSEYNVENDVDIVTSFFGGTNFIDVQLNENRTVTSFSRPGLDFVAANPGLNISAAQNDNVVTANEDAGGAGGQGDSEQFQIGANLVYDVSDTFSITTDLSYSEATQSQLRPFIVVGALAQSSPTFQLNPGDDLPAVIINDDLSDINAQRAHVSRIQNRDNSDEILEFRVHGDWEIDKGPLSKLSAGVLYSDREKAQVLSGTDFGAFLAYLNYRFPIAANGGGSILRPIVLDDFLSDVSGSENINGVGFTFDALEYLDFLGLEENLRNPERRAGFTPEQTNDTADVLLALPGGAFSLQPIPTGGFNVQEETMAFWANSQWEGDFGGELPWEANFGVRLVSTDVISTGFGRELLELRQAAGGDTLEPTFGPDQALVETNSYQNFLPSFNLKVDVAEDMVVRFAYAETVTRPTLTSLGTNNVIEGRIGNAFSSGGNPFLEPFESENYDVSYEWYYAPASFFGASVFHKEFSSFLASETQIVQREFIDNLGNTQPIDFEDTRIRNGEEGSISGFEAAIQHSFTGGALDGFGAAANYTYVTSNVDRVDGSSAFECDYDGLSPNTLNVSGFYEKNGVQARLAYNWRDEFLIGCFEQRERPESREAFGQLDFSASYDINDMITIFADGVNILEEDIRDFSVLRERFIQYARTGSRYSIGVRAKF